MGPLSRWAVRNPWKAVGIWVLLMVAVFAGASRGADFNEAFNLPDTESNAALQMLQEDFGSASNDALVAKIVFSPTEGKVTDRAAKREIEAVLTDIEAIKTVESVQSPFAPAGPPNGATKDGDAESGSDAGSRPEQGSASDGEGGSDTDAKGAANPLGTAGTFMAPISPDRTVAYATVTFEANDEGVASTKDVNALAKILKAAPSDTLAVGGAGSILDWAGQEPPKSEGIGILVALVILLLMFGSVVAAGLPIVSAVIGLATGIATVTLSTQVFSIPEFATVLATMIGLGVGIDYSLFVINRFKAAIDVGRDKERAATEAVNTAGRAVLFAATTVMIALAGLFVLGVEFMNGLAISSIIVVASVALTALWLLPALLSLLGAKAFKLKLPWRREIRHFPNGTPMARHANNLQKRPWLGLVALVVLVVVALPTFSLQSGFADNGGAQEGSFKRVGYDLLSEGYGPGINGPFIVVAELPEKGELAPAAELAKALQGADGVAGATSAFPNTEDPADATAALVTVYPTSSPQDEATNTLLQHLRNDVIPPVSAETGLTAYVGGGEAINEDFSQVLEDALPIFLTVVIGLGFLALAVLFRSLVVPLTAAVTSLLSFAVGLGVTVAVFQWGWGADLIGLESTGPIVPFLPVMLFAILFGLSMDYQVFLVSRMQEEWAHTGDNRRAIRRGMAGSGRVVAAAAAIMGSVFFAFVIGDDAQAKTFGLALGTAVLFDAFLVRLVLVPCFMTVVGSANWWLPGWLDRLLPHFQVETDEEFEAEEALIEDIPDADAETAKV